jgi:hypothetical protein
MLRILETPAIAKSLPPLRRDRRRRAPVPAVSLFRTTNSLFGRNNFAVPMDQGISRKHLSRFGIRLPKPRIRAKILQIA